MDCMPQSLDTMAARILRYTHGRNPPYAPKIIGIEPEERNLEAMTKLIDECAKSGVKSIGIEPSMDAADIQKVASEIHAKYSNSHNQKERETAEFISRFATHQREEQAKTGNWSQKISAIAESRGLKVVRLMNTSKLYPAMLRIAFRQMVTNEVIQDYLVAQSPAKINHTISAALKSLFSSYPIDSLGLNFKAREMMRVAKRKRPDVNMVEKNQAFRLAVNIRVPWEQITFVENKTAFHPPHSAMLKMAKEAEAKAVSRRVLKNKMERKKITTPRRAPFAKRVREERKKDLRSSGFVLK